MQAVQTGDIKRAKALSRLDAINQIPNAMYNQGLLEYANGSVSSAKSWFSRATKAGVSEAKVAEGILYFSKGDYKKVLSYLKGVKTPLALDLQAVSDDLLHQRERANATSYYRIADLFYDDTIVKTQERLAFSLMKIAADKGNGAAQNELGEMYRNGFAGQYQNNVTNALKYLQKAQKSGVVEAIFHQGMIYMQAGRGVRNIDTGMQLLHDAASKGSQRAAAALATYYYDGVGVSNVSRDFNKAFLYAKQSEKRCSSKKILVQLYRYGRGVSADKKKAKIYEKSYQKCSQNNDEDREIHLPLLRY